MKKNVLVIYYSQTGQQEEIMKQVTAPLQTGEITLHYHAVAPEKSFAFPWSAENFFEAMPESVLGIPSAIQATGLNGKRFDLVILGYQPWFLSPSIPATSLLHDPVFRSVIRDTPVITVIGARNMWLNAQERMKQLLRDAGAKLVGNIVLVDQHLNPVSAVTILYWMFSGKKDRFLHLFPVPGVSGEDIRNSARFGTIIVTHLLSGQWDGLQTELVREGAAKPLSNLMFVESRAGRIFQIWARIIHGNRRRKLLLVVFKYYLMFALFILAPILLTIDIIFFRPFQYKSIRRKKEYFAGI